MLGTDDWKDTITALRQASSSQVGRVGSSCVLKERNAHVQPGSDIFVLFNPETPLQGEKGGSVVTYLERSLLTQEKVVEFKTDALASDKSHS